ncbi:hypothetical protein BOX15_Mlig020472g2 [Macrostomum lignano]|uniref:Uncharacterized protein n=1 Tax=Macrostomum lignano TaxID=282301 RepID=A0A267F2M0_9PLAT|nr:hypothetical protein BOX15_Mlig020472g2 [Macrostomum lignano]
MSISPGRRARRPGTSDIDPEEDEEFACQRDVRFADTTETPDSQELAATAENYQLESEAPIVRDVTEDEKQFVGDLTEIGSPVTNSENPTSMAATEAASASAVAPTVPGRRNVASPTSSSSSTQPWQQRRQRQQQRQLTSSTSSPMPSLSTTSSKSKLLPVDEPDIPKAAAAASTKSKSPKASLRSRQAAVSTAEWTEKAENTSVDETRHLLSDEAPPDTSGVRILHRVGSSEWPADWADEQWGTDNQGATVAAASNSDAAPSADHSALRTRFEATFDRPDRLSDRLLQRFEVTYDKKQKPQGESSGTSSSSRSPARRVPHSRTHRPRTPRTPPKTFTAWQQLPQDRPGQRSVFAMDDEDDGEEAAKAKKPQSEDSVVEAAGPAVDTSTSSEDFDDFFDDEPMFKPSKTSKPTPDNPQPVGAAAKEDAELFYKLLNALDTIMNITDEKMNKKNAKNANYLIGKEASKGKQAESEKGKTSTAFNDSRTSEDVGTDAQTTAAARALVKNTEAAATQSYEKRPEQAEEGSSSDVSSQDSLSINKVDPRNAEKPCVNQEGSGAYDLHPSGNLHQVYSAYLAKDSSDKVKRQIGTHYLRQYYGPAERQGQKDEQELTERKRRAKQKKTRLSQGLGYCTYLMPLLFVIAIFGAICYFGFYILVSRKLQESYSLIMFSITTTAGGMFYCYNIFASEQHGI